MRKYSVPVPLTIDGQTIIMLPLEPRLSHT